MKIVVEVEASVYASEQYQSRIGAPSVCPNCGMAQSSQAHGYYRRAGSVRLSAARYYECRCAVFCRCCAVTVSCLPRFAQPYRIARNATIEAFFEGRTARRRQTDAIASTIEREMAFSCGKAAKVLLEAASTRTPLRRELESVGAGPLESRAMRMIAWIAISRRVTWVV